MLERSPFPLVTRAILGEDILGAILAKRGRDAAPRAHCEQHVRAAKLKILTWNIWMMPRFVHASPKNEARASAIAETLEHTDFDVLCLQKAFDGGARDVLRARLKHKFPYAYGPANPGNLLHTNSGVWMLTRFPLSHYREIDFNDAAGVEKFSRKGAMMLDGEVEGRRFQIVATHLQGDDAPTYRADRQKIRARQMQQLESELIRPHTTKGVPLFICGDMCTPHREEENHFFATDPFQAMLATFHAETADDELITLVDDRTVNDLADDDKKRRAQLDYVLLRKNGVALEGCWARHVFQRPGWDAPGPRRDLSYRYAIGAEFEWNAS